MDHDPALIGRRMSGMADCHSKDTLFYDGACPMCRTEVGHLRRLSGGRLAFVDVHSLADDAPEKTARLQRLHLETADGKMLSGLDANVTAWQHTRFGALFRPLRWPFIRQLADKAYGAWAASRYRRLYGGSKTSGLRKEPKERA